jgi:polar amino acid transport system permease protein
VLQAKIDTAQTYNYTPYVVAGIPFVLLIIPMTRLTDAIAKRRGWTRSGGTV